MSCAQDLRYRATQDFYRIEALVTARNDPADPLWLNVRITPADDLTNEIESALVDGAQPHGVVVTQNSRHPYRLFTGTWAYDIDQALYEVGKQYTIHWRFSMQPDVLNVVRTNFVWQPVPNTPREPTGCILSGVVTRNRVPVAGARVIVEEYKNFLTLNHRLTTVDVTTDAFGYWWIEVARGSVQRLILGEMIEAIKIPDQPCISMADAPRWSADDLPKDQFGYPVPGLAGTKPPVAVPPGFTDCAQ